MNKQQAWRYFIVGVWVIIFAIIPSVFLFAIVYVIQRGALAGGAIGEVLMVFLIIIGGIVLVLHIIITGWAATKGVKQAGR